jgi:hypothetical protein
VGPAGDSTFAPGDTIVIVRREFAGSVPGASAHFTVVLPLDPADYSNSALVRFSAAGLTLAPLSHVTFTCEPRRAVRAGEVIFEGTFGLTGLVDDIAFSVEGTFDSTAITGVYRDARGATAGIRWTRDGTVVVE